MRSKEDKLAIVSVVLSGTPAQHYENGGIGGSGHVLKICIIPCGDKRTYCYI